MICPSCKETVSPTKFCSNCGAPLTKEEKKTQDEVSIEWLYEIFKDSAYNLGNIDKNDTSHSFTARHADKPNMYVDFRPGLRVLLLNSMWNIKAPGMLDRGEFYRAVNSMNVETISAQCSVDEKSLDSLTIQLSLFITDVISRADILAFLDLAIGITRRVLNQPRVAKIVK